MDIIALDDFKTDTGAREEGTLFTKVLSAAHDRKQPDSMKSFNVYLVKLYTCTEEGFDFQELKLHCFETAILQLKFILMVTKTI